MTYSQKEIYNYPITIAQFSVLFYRLLKTYEEDFYWCEKKSEDKLALDAMATILCNILKERLSDNQKILSNLSITFGDID
jgi:hypothetical protein